MRSRAFNTRQRIVLVIGFGAALYLLGSWLTTLGEGNFGWVAYAPLSNAVNTADFPGGLHPWARLLIWLALILIWAGASVVLLGSRPEVLKPHLRVEIVSDRFSGQAVPRGSVGYIIEKWEDDAFEIEIVDSDGATSAQFVASSKDIRPTG